MKKIFYIIVAIITLCNCSGKESQKALLPNVTGKPGEIVVILEERYNETEVRRNLEHSFMQSQIGLPQSEPLFNLIIIPPHAFKNIFEKHRSILCINIGEKYDSTEISVRENIWAKPQYYMNINATSDSAFVKILKEKESHILAYFMEADRKRTQAVQQLALNSKGIDQLRKTFDLEMDLPAGYELSMPSPDFAWIAYETAQTSQGIFVYSYPYTSTSLLDGDNLIKMRDSLLQANVPGPRDSSYMATETYYPVNRKVCKALCNMYTVEMRGLWNVKNDYMGGPFVSYTTIDTLRNRVITIDGYVYAPKYKKRNYLREVEAIMRTLRINPLTEK